MSIVLKGMAPPSLTITAWYIIQNDFYFRYPIHWHLMGNVSGMYVRRNAIHKTFNRAVTIHGKIFQRKPKAEFLPSSKH